MPIIDIYKGDYVKLWIDGGDYIYLTIGTNELCLILKEDWEEVKQELLTIVEIDGPIDILTMPSKEQP